MKNGRKNIWLSLPPDKPLVIWIKNSFYFYSREVAVAITSSRSNYSLVDN